MDLNESDRVYVFWDAECDGGGPGLGRGLVWALEALEQYSPLCNTSQWDTSFVNGLFVGSHVPRLFLTENPTTRGRTRSMFTFEK